MKIITKNAAKCLKCQEVIESKHRHDFKFCKCNSIFIDGGLDYVRFGGEKEDIELLTEYKEE